LLYPVVKDAFVHEKRVLAKSSYQSPVPPSAIIPTIEPQSLPDSPKLPSAPKSYVSTKKNGSPEINIAQSIKIPTEKFSGGAVKVEKHITTPSLEDKKVITPNLPEDNRVEFPEPSRYDPKIAETEFERYLRVMANICSVLFPVAGTTLSLLWRYEVIHPPGSKMKRRRMERDEDEDMFVV
jgi:hypothetical protein